MVRTGYGMPVRKQRYHDMETDDKDRFWTIEMQYAALEGRMNMYQAEYKHWLEGQRAEGAQQLAKYREHSNRQIAKLMDHRDEQPAGMRDDYRDHRTNIERQGRDLL